jgi:methyl-accepting chemotaxis protein
VPKEGIVMNLGRLSISRRLGIGLGLIIALMVVLTVTGIWSLAGINGRLEQIINVNNEKISLAYKVKSSVDALDKSIMAIVVANDETIAKEEKTKIEAARTTYQDALGKLEKVEKSAKGKELIAAIKDNITIARTANDKVLELMSSGSSGGAGSQAGILLTGTLQISNMLNEACNELVKFQQERIGAAAKEARATYIRAKYMLIILGAVVFAFAVFLSSFLARSITKPLSEGVAVAQRIAEGDLTTQIDVTGADETSQLLGAMKDMVQALQHIIGEVKTASGNMASASQQLNSSSDLMSKGAGEQASRAAQVATASEEMSQTILDVARNTSNIETSATDTVKLAQDGEVAVDRSVEKVKSIARTIGESAKLIKSLGERSNQIGEIVNVINDIADQTNLLALNAAIEAARAGDVGRGFAVVADEVKKLAERTGNSTAEIGGMVKSIQNEVHQAVIAMENITAEVKSGVDLSAEAGDVLRGVVGSVDQLHVMVQQIASAAEEMASTSEEINRDIETIASVSKETSGNSEDIARASQELATLSVNLEKVVGGFRV